MLRVQVMGFIPESVDPEESGLVEPLGRVMVQLVGGGGAAKVNIDKVPGRLHLRLAIFACELLLLGSRASITRADASLAELCRR